MSEFIELNHNEIIEVNGGGSLKAGLLVGLSGAGLGLRYTRHPVGAAAGFVVGFVVGFNDW
jgi:hypothetical protein